jgi:hypothetical protein
MFYNYLTYDILNKNYLKKKTLLLNKKSILNFESFTIRNTQIIKIKTNF